MRRLQAILLLLLMALPLQAQEPASEPLVVPFFPAPPFSEYAADGTRSGFSIELARLIGEEVGVDIELLDVPNTPAFVEALASGEAQLFPGIAQLPVLSDSNVFSDVVVTDTLRFVVLEDRVETFEGGQVVDRRLGIVPPALGSQEAAVLAQNQVVEFANPKEAIMGLLIGDVDALLIPNPVAYSIARQAKADGRIRFFGDPVRSVVRVVSLHESRAELLEPINEAIARLEEDGRLEALRQRFNVIVPPPPPEVLTIGVTDFPPYNIRNDDGTFTGFSVETARDLARLAGLQVQFKPISNEEFAAGPTPNTYDILPQIGVNEERRARMDITLATERYELAIFTRSGESAGRIDLDDLAGRKIGVEAVSIARRFAEDHGGLDTHVFDGANAVLQALADGEVDAILYSLAAMNAQITSQGYEEVVEAVLPPFRVVERAPALRHGLGGIRERLNAVIPGYLLSDEYAALREEYFGEPKFWTPMRSNIAVASAVSVLVLSILGFLFARRRAQSRAEQAKLKFLDQVVSNMSSQVLLLDREDRIIFGNTENNAPGGSWAAEVVGKRSNFADAISKLVRRNAITMEGKSQTDTLDTLLTSARQDGSQIEYEHDGRHFRRRAWKLDDGVALLVRDDITLYRDQLQKEQAHSDELGKLIAELERSNRELDEFAYIASHDLKEPLRGIAINANFLLREDLPDKARERALRMNELAGRMEQLISDLLFFSRLGRKDEARVVVQPGQVIDAIRTDLSEWLAEQGGEVIQVGAIPSLRAERVKVKTVLQNLIVNGIKYNDAQEKRVEIGFAPKAKVHGQSFRNAIFVKDNGIGIDDQHRDKIFRIFSRLNKKSDYPVGTGTGSGLAFVRKIVEEHGGTIDFTSEPGKGSTFYVTLPLANNHV